MTLSVLIGLAAGVVGGVGLGAIAALTLVRTRAQADLRVARESAGNALAKAETTAKEIVLTAKEEAHQIRSAAEGESRERQNEILELERRAQQREESILARLDELEHRQEAIKAAEAEQERLRDLLLEREARLKSELESVSGMSRDQARTNLLSSLERDLSQEVAHRIRESNHRPGRAQHPRPRAGHRSRPDHRRHPGDGDDLGL